MMMMMIIIIIIISIIIIIIIIILYLFIYALNTHDPWRYVNLLIKDTLTISFKITVIIYQVYLEQI